MVILITSIESVWGVSEGLMVDMGFLNCGGMLLVFLDLGIGDGQMWLWPQKVDAFEGFFGHVFSSLEKEEQLLQNFFFQS